MRKLNKQYNKLDEIKCDLEEIISELEDKRDAIEEHACDMDREMTEKEQERFDEIGYNGNAYLDGNEYTAWKEADLIEYIIEAILKEENYLEMEDSWELLEAKHVRFMGAEKVKEIVKARVMARHLKEGKWEWEK